MDNSIIAVEKNHDLQILTERIDYLERVFFDCQKISILHSYIMNEELIKGQPISNDLEAIHKLTEAIDAYRAALRLSPRFSKMNDFSMREPNRNAVQMISVIKDKVFEYELDKLQCELKEIRRKYFYLKHFVRAQQLVNGILRVFNPKLGKLYLHEPVSMGSWGLPPKILIPNASVKNPPTISMVTPSFRQGSFIGRTIESVVNQNYPGLEYFVQDGGSDDGTVSVVKSFETKLAGWKSEPDSGQSQAINRGFSQTTGEIMAWLNSDDLLMPGTLAYVANFFVQHPDVDVVYGHRILINEQDKEIARWILPKHDDDVLSWADFVPQETLFWRRSIWDKAGGHIDESFRFAMDWDLLIRFREAGARMVRLPFFMGAFRIHEAQKTSATINSVGMLEMDRLRERCHGRKPGPIDIRTAVAPYMLRHMVEDFYMRLKRTVGML